MLTAVIAISAIALTVWLMSREVNIGIILLIDSLVVVVATRMPPGVSLSAAAKGALSERCLGTIAILVLIMILERSMRDEGMLSSLAQSLKQLVGNGKAVAYLMPAVIGMLPSPGGARFSCPMVEEVAGNRSSQETKAFVNYWFRHVWQDCFFLYPSAIAASKILGLNVFQVSLPVMAFGVFHAWVGWMMTRREVDALPHVETGSRRDAWRGFAKAAFPVVEIIFLYMVFNQLHVPFDLEIAAVITLATLFALRRFTLKKIGLVVKNAFQPKYILIILGVMIFMEIFTQSGLVGQMLDGMTSLGLPKEVFFVLLPMVAGVSSGFSLSTISLTFPILAPMGLTANLLYVACAYVSGFIGNMITPMHLCGVMTSEYFGVKMNRILARVMKGELAVLALVAMVLLLLRI